MLHYNQITHLIAELLFKHDCVIVPNFGGFVARNYSSNFNKGSNVLYPQSKHILFNKNFTQTELRIYIVPVFFKTIKLDKATIYFFE